MSFNEDKIFGKSFNIFLKGNNLKQHKKAIIKLLSFADLDRGFKDLLNEKKGIENFFSIWSEASLQEKDKNEQEGLKELAKYTKKYFKSKKYQKLCGVYFEIAFRHLCSYFEIEKRSDFKTLTDEEMFTKGIIPDELVIPYFLFETLQRKNNFNWNRSEEICRQNLACMIVCFADIYEYLNAEECLCPECASERNISDAKKTVKIPRNAPCPCGSLKNSGRPKKYKHCCGK